MLLRCCVIIFILSLKTVSSITINEVESKEEKYRVFNEDPSKTMSVSRITREKINKTPHESTTNKLTNTIELRGHTGRFLEEYTILTKDEYILKIFRLTYENRKVQSRKYPVLLAHGMFQSSDRFLQLSEERSLAFKLQDYGYDVWLANMRGNKYGRRHTHLDPEEDKIKFFNYTYEEIGLYDIAATVDFVLNVTKFEKMHYIGYSLGGTSFLVLNSKEPMYNDKFALSYLLAPIGYQKFFPNSDLQDAAHRSDKIYEDILKQGVVEIFPYQISSKDKLFRIGECLGNEAYQDICRQIKIDEIMGIKHRGNTLADTRGGSIKQLAHLAQNIRSKTFSQWDYGEEGNEEHYGTKEAPTYNLGFITAKTKIIYAPNDDYVSPKDIVDMAGDMANAVAREVGRKDFKHQDFIVAPDVMDMLYGDIIKELEENANNKLSKTRRDDPDTTTPTPDTTTKNSTAHDEDDDDKEKEPNWFMVCIGPLIIFLITLFIVVLLKTVTFEFFMEL